MFVIKNVTDSDIVLDDLNLVIGRQKEIDLDAAVPRQHSDLSKKLKAMIHQGRIAILRREDINERLDPESGIDVYDLNALEHRLKEEMMRQTRAKDQQIGELTAALKVLVQKLTDQPPQVVIQQVPGNGNSVNPSTNFDAASGSTQGDISDDIASRLHAKAVQKMQAKVVGHVEHETKNTEDTQLNQNIKELEGLL